jgi:hypothetical protein
MPVIFFAPRGSFWTPDALSINKQESDDLSRLQEQFCPPQKAQDFEVAAGQFVGQVAVQVWRLRA